MILRFPTSKIQDSLNPPSAELWIFRWIYGDLSKMFPSVWRKAVSKILNIVVPFFWVWILKMLELYFAEVVSTYYKKCANKMFYKWDWELVFSMSMLHDVRFVLIVVPRKTRFIAFLLILLIHSHHFCISHSKIETFNGNYNNTTWLWMTSIPSFLNCLDSFHKDIHLNWIMSFWIIM